MLRQVESVRTIMAHLQMKFALAVLCLALVNYVTSKTLHPAPKDDEDVHLSTPELIAKYGYPSETHMVTTEDGYILQMHRIPHGKNQPPDENRPPVLVQHGLMSSSSDWVIMGPGTALAYLLADAGYDVWLGNIRGNIYSRGHISLDPDQDKEYWKFSWHEMAKYDLPAMIDYILKETQEEKLHYIGHSMGTTMFYVMCSERPEYNDKIKAMFSMAPIAFISHTKSPLLQLAAEFEPMIEILLGMMGDGEFMPNNELMSMLETALCQEEAITSDICLNIVFLVCGFDSVQLDMDKLPVIIAHSSAGTSTKTFLHYAQELTSAKFRQYDYGAIENLIVYGQIQPPDYQLNKVTAPVALIYSVNDWLAAVEDVDELYSKLGNPIGKFLVPFDKFNHLDYVCAIQGPELVYNDMIKLMGQY